MRNEFNFIDDIKARFCLAKIGDDCAVLQKDECTDLLISSDLIVENIDFRTSWSTPEFIGQKALAVSLSDIAAMGGRPVWAMLSLAVPENLWKSDFLDRFYNGWQQLATRWEVELVGGDISRIDGPLVIDTTVAGEVNKGKAILRSGAKPGDGIFVTGDLGGAAEALFLLEHGSIYETENEDKQRILSRQLTPEPRVAEGIMIGENSLATAMIDISDGLSSDLKHLVNASSVGADLDLTSIPTFQGKLRSVGDEKLRDRVFNGGEDFELLFTVDEKNLFRGELAAFHRIGTITPTIGVIRLTNGDSSIPIPSKGFRHF